jgi:PHD/YefM family antitoxin component YafN of YafNO toxin-antitoxin module
MLEGEALKETAMAAPELPRERYIVDSDGRRIAVVIDIEAWEAMMELLEDLEDIRAAEEASREPGVARPVEEVFAEIERERGWDTR